MNTEINWKFGKTRDNIDVRWIPICTVESSSYNKRIIGLSQDGHWINALDVNRTNDLFVIKDREDCYWIMAILDKERFIVEELLKKGIEQNKLAFETFSTFPFVEIVKFCLANDGNHWGIRAAAWLKPDEFDDEMCLIVKKIIDNKSLDQKTRHRLFKLMRNYENN